MSSMKQELGYEHDAARTVSIERRARKRYDIRSAVDVTGATPSHRLISGWSVDISSIGVRIESEALARYQPFQPGATVVIAADWPVLHNQLTPLRLIMIGELVRSTSSDLAVRIQRHYFELQSR